MMSWSDHTVEFKFRLGEVNLFTARRRLQVANLGLEALEADIGTSWEEGQLSNIGQQGHLIRSMPAAQPLSRVQYRGEVIVYVPRQYERYYVSLGGSFEDYLGSFSSKSRSTLRRKLRKFAEAQGGDIPFSEYRSAEEIETFYRLARQVSAHTYQEVLLGMGLPKDGTFKESMHQLAEQDRVRGYILFDGEHPIAYLYCPVQAGSVLYQYLGYLPDRAKWSPGTVLLLKVLERLFSEGKFRYFDFTEGGPEGNTGHKGFFATNFRRCADVYYLPRTPANLCLVWGHTAIEMISSTLGSTLDRLGLKRRVKQLLRTLKGVR